MIIKKVNYVDLDGNEVTEELRFHLSKDELREFNARYPGGLKKYVNDNFDEKNFTEETMMTFYKILKDLLIMSYGVKSADARHFVKNEEIREAFKTSLAFDKILEELISDPSKIEEFFIGVAGITNEEYNNIKKEASKEVKAIQ